MRVAKSGRPEADNRTPTLPRDHFGALLVSVVLMVVGWLGMAETISQGGPTLRSVFQFILLLFCAASGTAMPFIFYFNVRFVPVTRRVPSSAVIVRQSAWVGSFVVGCASLQLLYLGEGRALTPATALALAGFLALLEWNIQRRVKD